jgi:hypothetical protein
LQRAALTATSAIEAGQDHPLPKRKLALTRYWFEREMPLISALRQRALVESSELMEISADAF